MVKKWQTEPFTENTLRQLEEEPKVLIQHRLSSKDYNVPDISNVANYEECLSSEDIYITKKPKTNWKNSYDDGKDIEGELSRMFENEPKQIPLTPKKTQKNRKRNFLIRLFGSPLDDINPKKIKSLKFQKVEGRRLSLPVSIDIDHILPVKVAQKRRSEPDACTSPKKVQKLIVPLNGSIEELRVEYDRVCNLVIPPVFREVGRLLYSHNDLEVAVISPTPTTERSKSAKQTMQSPFIDLTEDGDDVYVPSQLHLIKTDQETFSSEQANVPVSTIPGPVSPAEPTQAEGVVGQSSQRPPPMTKLHIGGLEITPVQHPCQNHNQNQKPQNAQSMTIQKIQPVQKPESGVQAMIDKYRYMRQYGVGQVTNHPPNHEEKMDSHIQPSSVVHWKTTPICDTQCQIPPQPPVYNVQPWQNYPAKNPLQPLPNLSRLYQTAPVMEYELITNLACAQKIFPHVFGVVSWRMHAISYHEKTKKFSLPGAKDIETKLNEYCQQFNEMFGVNMVKDLSTVDVHEFSIFEILTIVAKALTAYQVTLGVYRVCHILNLLVTPARSHCTSPFLKRFYNTIKLSCEKLAEKTAKVPIFTTLQLKCLEMQIQSYLLIEQWLKKNPIKPVAKRQYKKKATQPNIKILQNTLIRNTGQTVLKASLSTTKIVQSSPLRAIRVHNYTEPTNIEPVQPLVVPPQPSREAVPPPTRNGFMEAVITKLLSSSDPSVEKVPQPTTTSEAVPRNGFTFATNISEPTSEEPVISNPTVTSMDDDQQNVPEELKTEECNVDVEIKSNDENEVTSTIKNGDDEIVDLTWIDDVDEVEIFEDMIETKSFPFKIENTWGNDQEVVEREVVSPSDSGVGSPPSQIGQNDDSFKCLCGNKASYVCACNSSMYCSKACQEKDWVYHQKLCQKMKS